MARKNKNKKVGQGEGGSKTKKILFTVILTNSQAWSTNDDGTLTPDCQRIMSNILEDSKFCTFASARGDCVLKAMLMAWKERGCPTTSDAENLPNMSSPTTFERMCRPDLYNCTVHEKILEARETVEQLNPLDQSFNGPTIIRQAYHLGRNKKKQFSSFMNNLFTYLEWVGRGYLSAIYPEMSREVRKSIGEQFMRKICNWPDRTEPEELTTSDAIALINEFRGVLGLNEDDTETKITQEWIKEDLLSRKNRSIKLILRLSEYQIQNSTDDKPLRQIPISQTSSNNSKGAHYTAREIVILLRASSKTSKQNLKGAKEKDHDYKDRAFNELSKHLNFFPFQTEICRFISFFCNGEKTCLNYEKEVPPRFEKMRTANSYLTEHTENTRGDCAEFTFDDMEQQKVLVDEVVESVFLSS